ncbi:lipase 1-like [Aricia agestis]|uniref:lipase 1-like n=1 Tax=Aricia agestis TaxID=91739 RepID=UPI001C204638|nr:lipase 1-like [Aricia agestis]
MASKAKVTLHALLLACTVVLAHLARSALPVSDATKRYLGTPRAALLNFTETCAAHRYRAEEHRVRTADGYLLTVFRVGRAGCAPRRPPVLLMHGLLQSADAFLDPGPRAGLPYLLADRCFDVWVGNMRGNYYARRHETLDPDRDAAFWDFGVEEIGLHDIPATIDYVLQHTGARKLNYVGFSQGSGTFFVMCSEVPGACDKVNVHIGLAPAARQTHTRSVIYRAFAATLRKLRGVLAMAGYNEVLARGALGHEFLAFMCHLSWKSEKLCGTAEAMFDSFHPGSISNDTLFNMFGHFPAGTSLKTFVRYAQSFESPRFAKFDYGEERNRREYGDARPPSYNLSAVTAPSVILYGRNDHLVDVQDVAWLVRRLPRVLEATEVAEPLWNHFDCTYSRHIPDMIFPTVYKYLLRYSVT